MPETSVIILAAGEQKRWAAGGYKQLCTVDGETVIERMIRMAITTFHVTPWVAVKENNSPFGYGIRYFYPESYARIVDTFSSTEKLWGDTTVILLGDVFYPEVAMDIIYLKDFFAYSGAAEIFALKFTRAQWQNVRAAIEKVKDSSTPGKLWNVYRAYDGIGLNDHQFGPCMYRFRDADRPHDFDTIQKYNEFIERRAA